MSFECSEASLDNLEKSQFVLDDDKDVSDMEITRRVDLNNKTEIGAEGMEMDK